MKKIFSVNLVLLFSVASQAQLYPVFSQYYFNELMINPAYAGAHVQFSATATYRKQWVNFPGAPSTYSFTAHTSFIGGRVGLGIMFNEDRIGSYSNQDITMSYSYKLKFPKATLSFGIQGMIYIVGADFSNLNLRNPTSSDFATYNQAEPNIGAGIYYNQKHFFVGFSMPYLISSQYRSSSTVSTALIQQERNYFLRSGYIIPINKNIKFNPSILIRSQEGQPLSMDFNTAFIFNDLFSAGICYRSGDAIISVIGIKLLDKIHVNYSFDFTSSKLRPFASGTHEIMINYRAKLSSIHKELDCPSFYNYR